MKRVSISMQKYKFAAFDPFLSVSFCVAHTPLKGEVDLFALFMVDCKAECVLRLLSNKALSVGYKGSHSY